MINNEEKQTHQKEKDETSKETKTEPEKEPETGMKHLLEIEKETRDYSEENTPGEDVHQETSDERENSKEEYDDINDMNENENEYYIGGTGKDKREKIKNTSNEKIQDGGVLLKSQKKRMHRSIVFLGQSIDDETTSKMELMTKEEKENIIQDLKDAMKKANEMKCPHCKIKSYQVKSIYDFSRMQKKIFFKCYRCNRQEPVMTKEKISKKKIPLEFYVILNLGEVIRMQSDFSLEMKNQIMLNKNNFMFGFHKKEEAEKIHNDLFRKLILVQEGFVKYLHMYMVLGYGFMPEESTIVSSLMQKYTQEDIRKMFDGETKEEERRNLETAIQENILKLKNFVQEKNMEQICKTSDEILEQMKEIKKIVHLQNSIYGEIYLTIKAQSTSSTEQSSISSDESISLDSSNLSVSSTDSLTTGGQNILHSKNTSHSRTPKYLMKAYKQYKMFNNKNCTIKRNQNIFPLLFSNMQQTLQKLPLLNIYI